MQQGICQARLGSEIRCVANQRTERMIGWQGAEAFRELADFVAARADTKTAAIVLQHVDSGASVRRVQHQVHRPVGCEHLA